MIDIVKRTLHKLKNVKRTLHKRVEFKSMSDMQLGDKARYCQQLLDNPIFMDIFSTIEQELTDTWKNSPISDKEGREFVYLRLEALRKFRYMLEGYISEADYERKMQEEREEVGK